MIFGVCLMRILNTGICRLLLDEITDGQNDEMGHNDFMSWA